LVADPPLDLLREGLREPAHVREQQLGLDRRQDVETGRARGLRVARQPELVEYLTDDERDCQHVVPLVVRRRVQVDQHVVGPLDVVDPRVPRVELDAAEVDDPRERGRVVDDGEDGRVAAREADELLANVVGVRGNALLVEEVALDAVRVALHVERPPADVVERARRHVDVVLDEVVLRQTALGEERFLRVRDLDLVAADSHLARKLRPKDSEARLA